MNTDSVTGADDIVGVARAEYGESYCADSVAIYVAYLGHADEVADRRQRANSFGLTVNTALVGLAAYLEHTGVLLTPLLSAAGIMLSLTWHRQIKAYRLVNRAKFQVIDDMEARLPLKPYHAEWKKMSSGTDPERYLSLSRLESVVPLVFMGLHLVALAASVLL